MRTDELLLEIERLRNENHELKNKINLLSPGGIAGENELVSYSDLIHNINDIVFAIDEEGKFLFISDQAEALFGYKANEFIGQPFAKFVGKNIQTISDRFKLIHELGSLRNDYEFPTKDGGSVWVQLSTKLIKKDGKTGGVFGTIIDISDKKQKEEIISSQNKHLRAVLNAIPDLVFVINHEGKYLDFYSGSEEWLFIDNSKILGTFISDAFPPDLADLHISNLHKCLSRQEMVIYEYKLPFEGKDQLFEARLSPINESTVISLVRNITENKNQLALINKLSMAVEQSPVMTMFTNMDGIVEYVNKTFEEVMGYSKSEILGQNASLLLSNENKEGQLDEMIKAIRNGMPWKGEFITVNKFGHRKWDEAFMNVIKDENNVNAHILAVIQDITDRKQAELEILELNTLLENRINERTKELKIANGELMKEIHQRKSVEAALTESEEKYRQVVENVKEVIFITDNEGIWTFLNNSWEEVTGFSTRESLGKPFYEFVYPDDRELNRTLFEPLIKQEKDYCNHEIRYLHKDGGYRWIEVFARLGLNSANEAIGTYGTLQDITERKAVEELIKLQKTRLENTIEGANIGTWEWNIQTNEMHFNDKWANTVGYSIEEIEKEGYGFFAKINHPDDVENIKFLLGEHFSGKSEYYTNESRLKHRDGHYVWVFDRGKVISRTPDGKPEWMYGIHQDITARKMVEFEIMKAREEAEKANKAKSEFLSRMSHELRTPMNSILGFAQLLEMGELKPSQTKAVNYILNSGHHLLKLINEVLDISRIESGTIHILLEPVNIYSLLREVIDLNLPLENKKNVEVHLHENPELHPYIQFDSQKLRQIIINILNNAIKYNKDGGEVNIYVEFLPNFSEDQKGLRITISDTGKGISKDNLEKVFNPFERIGAERSEVEGTGLGLAVVERLANAVGAKIGVESELGKGSSFWLDIPYLISESHSLNEMKANLGSNQQKVHAGSILYIEDNHSNVELVEEILQTQRKEIKVINSIYGRHGFELAREYKPGLILLDLNLPDISGSEVLEMLLNDPNTMDIPVVMISADAMPAQINRLLSQGAREYLSKPIDVQGFVEMVDKYIVL